MAGGFAITRTGSAQSSIKIRVAEQAFQLFTLPHGVSLCEATRQLLESRRDGLVSLALALSSRTSSLALVTSSIAL